MKKMKKYQKGGSQVKRPSSDRYFQVVDDNTIGSTTGYRMIKRPEPISSDSLAKERFADMQGPKPSSINPPGFNPKNNRNIDPGFKPKSKPSLVTPMKKGGPVTALNKVQEMYSKKKK
jgi:hypothetical protein